MIPTKQVPLDVAVLRTRVVGGDGIRGFPDAERVVGYPFDQIDSQSLPGSATVESEPTASAIDLERTPKPHSAIAPLVKCRWDQLLQPLATLHPFTPRVPSRHFIPSFSILKDGALSHCGNLNSTSHSFSHPPRRPPRSLSSRQPLAHRSNRSTWRQSRERGPILSCRGGRSRASLQMDARL